MVDDELLLVEVNLSLIRDSWCDRLWCLNLYHCRSGHRIFELFDRFDLNNWLNWDDGLGHCDRLLRFNCGLLWLDSDCLLRKGSAVGD